MPNYVIRFNADADTAQALLSLLIQNGSVFSYESIEEPSSNGATPVPPKKQVKHRGKLSAPGEIVAMCLAREDKTVTIERIRHVLGSKGFMETSVKPAVSKLNRSKYFTVTDKTVKLIDLAITPDNINKALTDKGIR